MIATDRLRRAMRDISAQKGDFTFFALLMRSDAPGTWDLVVAAPWLKKGKLKGLSEFIGLLAGSIGEQSLSQFARIVTIDELDPRLKAIVSKFSVDDGDINIQSSDLFGLDIEEAIIMRAKRAA
jgi:hypothetical protein